MRTLGLVLLALRACSGAAPPGDARTVPVADLSDAGTELTYRAFGPDGTFTETIAQNDAASTDLEGGRRRVGPSGTGFRHRVDPDNDLAREQAGLLVTRLETGRYDLEGMTTMWLARSDFRRLMNGEPVSINMDGTIDPFVFNWTGTWSAQVDGQNAPMATATFSSRDGRTLTVLDDADEPMIVRLEDGDREWRLESVARHVRGRALEGGAVEGYNRD